MRDSFKSIKGERRVEYRVKGSLFIATLLPVTSKEEVHKNLQRVKDELPGANHYVYSCSYMESGLTIIRESDDGEPAGSSGPPLSKILKGSGLINVMIVVTRYFGGTKLGLGGLARAYQRAGKLVLEKGEVVEVITFYPLEIKVDYPFLGDVLKVIEKYGAIKGVHYLEKGVLIEGVVRGKYKIPLKNHLQDASRGGAQLLLKNQPNG